MNDQNVEALLKKLIKWVESQPALLGAALVGSYARDEAKVDSDVDLVLLSTKPIEFIDKQSWISNFGKVKFSRIEDYGLVTSIRVHYEEGLEVEFGVTSTEWTNKPIDKGTRQVIESGIKILVDKKGLLNHVLEEATNSK